MAAAMVAAFAVAPSAQALTAGAPECSLPYVEDVNPTSGGYIATVSAAGSSRLQCRVTSGGKAVKVRKVAPRTWTAKLKEGRTYKVSVRAAGGSWRSIGYRIY